jgi:hypothetical protein
MNWQRRLVFVGLALTSSSAAFVVGAVLGALATAEPGGISATRRFEFLSRAADPVPALLALLGVVAVLVAEDGSTARRIASRIAIGTAAFFGVVIVLLAVNGILLDVTAAGASALVRLSRIVFLRLVPMTIAAAAVWLSLSEQAPPDSPASEVS